MQRFTCCLEWDKNITVDHFFSTSFIFQIFFLVFARGLNFANVNFGDMLCKINFGGKVEIQSAPSNHSTQGV